MPPLVSALMVTRNRKGLARRAVECFCAQTWSERELVIVDDGDEDYEPMLASYRERAQIRYRRVRNDGALRLGGLRNLSLDAARGDFCIQWDDDDWYHADRIRVQVEAAESEGAEAVVLHSTLMHLDTLLLRDRAFRSSVAGGTPGTILHRRSDVRYPNDPRAEDTAFRDALRRRGRLLELGPEGEHLFIRCFHGTNTWELEHFESRFRVGLLDRLDYWLSARVLRDLRRHRAFRLSAKGRAAAAEYLAHTARLGLGDPGRSAADLARPASREGA